MLIVTDDTIVNRGVLETRSLPKMFLGRVQVIPRRVGPRMFLRMVFEIQIFRYLSTLLPFVAIPLMFRDLALPIT